jgi:cytochrome P450
VWVLSRYADVLPAFREPLLWPTGSRGQDEDVRDEVGVSVDRRAILDGLSAAHVTAWRTGTETLVTDTLSRYPAGGVMDLLAELAMPVCLRLALTVTGADPADREHLRALSNAAYAASGTPDDSPARPPAAAAVAELKRYFASAERPKAEQTFMGVSQALPRLLANGWVALFREPAEVARLREQPSLVPGAVEELLRYAGIIPRLYRRAQERVSVNDLQLIKGDRVTLCISSANRDAAKFPDPDRLDVGRQFTGQLSLGIGRSSCAGARLIRMVQGVMLERLSQTFRRITLQEPIHWRRGGFEAPEAVPATLER